MDTRNGWMEKKIWDYHTFEMEDKDVVCITTKGNGIFVITGNGVFNILIKKRWEKGDEITKQEMKKLRKIRRIKTFMSKNTDMLMRRVISKAKYESNNKKLHERLEKLEKEVK